ncbi:Uncharacterised protein [Mycobacteroides abscessus subsp. abscessus]|nr:Uncharacterised protein [Mycobacteroides abscessus subsp. abscessus]
MAEGLPGVDIRYMYFNDRHAYACYAVPKAVAVMCKGSGIKDHAIELSLIRFIKLIDERPFMIGLAGFQFCPVFAGQLCNPLFQLLQCGLPINTGLPLAQHIQVRPV